jgi:phage head maturation protease
MAGFVVRALSRSFGDMGRKLRADYGRRGREAIVDPEITRREVISRVASGEYKNISFIHEIADSAVDDITTEILAEAALPEIALTESPSTGADLHAGRFDHARDLRKHEAV